MTAVRRFYNRHFSRDKDLVCHLKSLLGFTPCNIDIFKLAFHHKSNRQWVHGERIINNERLEYLGDSLLSTIVAEYLYRKYPDGDEGFLTKMRSRMVKRKTLNYIGEQMGLDIILKEFNDTQLSNSMLGNALEALVGAIYLDIGYDRTRNFVIRNVLKEHLNIHEIETTDDNFKSRLLEWGQKNNKSIEFVLIKKFKQGKRDRFQVAAHVNGQALGKSDHFNKKSAEQKAAQLSLKKLGILDKDVIPEHSSQA